MITGSNNIHISLLPSSHQALVAKSRHVSFHPDTIHMNTLHQFKLQSFTTATEKAIEEGGGGGGGGSGSGSLMVVMMMMTTGMH